MLSFDKERAEIDTWLRDNGIEYGVSRLKQKPALSPKCTDKLLELLERPYSPRMRAVIANALFDRGPNPSQKHKAMDIVLAALRENAGRKEPGLSDLADLVSGSALLKGYLIDNIDAGYVHDLGAMLLDTRYGKIREQFTYALRKIGNADAIAYLEQGALDPQMASFTLKALRLLREDPKTMALCQKALKIPGVCNKNEIVKTFEWIQRRLGFDGQKAEVSQWLRQKGIKHDLGELYDNPKLRPDCVPQLLELLKKPFKADVHIVIADALFRRKPDKSMTRKAVDIILARIHKFDGKTEGEGNLSLLISNELANNIEKDRVHEIGQMMLDKRYGDLRGDFTMVMWKIGGKEAVSYLQKAARDPQIASLALYVLARLGAEGTLQLCEKALKDSKVLYKDAIKETYKKLQRRAGKKQAAPLPIAKETVPKGLKEWSTNLDGEDLPKVLRRIAKCVDSGFAKAEISEICTVNDDLEVDQTARFKYDVKVGGKAITMWVEVFCDDENAPDLYIFGPKELIEKIDEATESFLR
jgi:hypothetical protein